MNSARDARERETADTASPVIRCPFCGADDTEEMGLFGTQLSTAQRYCRSCHTPFERFTREGRSPQKSGGEQAGEYIRA